MGDAAFFAALHEEMASSVRKSLRFVAATFPWRGRQIRSRSAAIHKLQTINDKLLQQDDERSLHYYGIYHLRKRL